MAKKNTASITATLVSLATTVDTIDGELVRQDEGALVLRVKKPRSSKYMIRVVPNATILSAWLYDTDDGQRASVTLRPMVAELDSVDGTIEVVDGFVTCTDENGNIFMVAADAASITGDDEEEEEKPAKKGKAAKKSSKKAKDEEEEEDDEDDSDDDDEDEDWN